MCILCNMFFVGVDKVLGGKLLNKLSSLYMLGISINLSTKSTFDVFQGAQTGPFLLISYICGLSSMCISELITSYV